jgi:hypothetical protein
MSDKSVTSVTEETHWQIRKSNKYQIAWHLNILQAYKHKPELWFILRWEILWRLLLTFQAGSTKFIIIPTITSVYIFRSFNTVMATSWS